MDLQFKTSVQDIIVEDHHATGIVLENGQIVEVGSTESLFLNPKSDTLKNFISITESFNKNKSFVGGEGIWVVIY